MQDIKIVAKITEIIAIKWIWHFETQHIEISAEFFPENGAIQCLHGQNLVIYGLLTYLNINTLYPKRRQK